MTAAHQSSVRTLADSAADLGQLGPAFGLLSQTETELSLPFTQVARVRVRVRARVRVRVRVSLTSC